jgi:hypothetical protein
MQALFLQQQAQQQQQQQQRPVQQDLGQLFDTLALATAGSTAPDTAATLALLAALGASRPQPTAAYASPAAIAAAAAAGGWNAAAYAALAGEPAAGGVEAAADKRSDVPNGNTMVQQPPDIAPELLGILSPNHGDCSGLDNTQTGDSQMDSSPVGSDETVTSESHELGVDDSSGKQQQQQQLQAQHQSKNNNSESEGSSES